jgi:ribosomal protein S10
VFLHDCGRLCRWLSDQESYEFSVYERELQIAEFDPKAYERLLEMREGWPFFVKIEGLVLPTKQDGSYHAC